MRVVVTATPETSARLAAPLRAEGLEVVERPLVRIEPLEGPPVRVDGYDWVVLTSRAGVECLLRRLEGPLPRVAAVGPGTAEALRAHGVEPALVASRSTQEGVAAELGVALGGTPGRVLFAGAEGARGVLARELGAETLVLYRTVAEPAGDLPEADVVVLASPSAARALASRRRDLACVAIGPITAAEARAQGLEVVAEAMRPEPEEVARAVRLALSRPS